MLTREEIVTYALALPQADRELVAEAAGQFGTRPRVRASDFRQRVL